MGKHPFNLQLPDNAEPVMSRSVHIGWLWPSPQPLTRWIDKSQATIAQKYDRWTSCTLDGLVASRNSRNKREATRTLARFIARRVKAATRQKP